MPKLSDSQQELRRTRILDAAEQCFARNGFHRTTMQHICREAGVSAGALYLYFPSKEALIEGISLRSREEVLESFEQFDDTGDFIAGLARLMDVCILAKPAFKSMLWLEISAEATRNPAIRKTHETCEKQINEALAALLEKARESGRVALLLPVSEIVETMMVIAHGLFLRRAVDPEFDAPQAGRTILPLLAGIVRPLDGLKMSVGTTAQATAEAV